MSYIKKIMLFFKNLEQSVKLFLVFQLIILSTSFFCYANDYVNIMILLLLIEFIFITVFCLHDLRRRFLLLFFNTVFAIFLCNQIFIDFFTGKQVLIGFDNKTVMFTVFSLVYSINLVSICFALFNSYTNSVIKINKHRGIEWLLIAIFSLSSLFVAIKYIELFLYLKEYGYLSIYSSFYSRLPNVIHQIANLYRISFFCLLALFPRKKLVVGSSLAFVIVSSLTMLSGARGTLMINLIVLFLYLFIRDYFKIDEKPFFTKKNIIICLVCIPILILIMNGINLLRYGNFSDKQGVMESMQSFFYNMGGSSKVISYSYVYNSQLNHDFIYSLSPITNIFYPTSFSPNTVEMATLTNNFQYAISYLALDARYLAGEGIGGSYIAEIFVDFGFYGITIISCLYGLFLAKVPQMFKRGFIYGAIALLSISAIMWAPRGSALEFISAPFESKNIIIFVIIYFIFIYKNEIIQRCKELILCMKKK